MLTTSFPIFQLGPNFKIKTRNVSESLHHIILGREINHTVPINTNLCNPTEVSKLILGVKKIKILLKSVMYKHIHTKLEKDECFRRSFLKRSPNYPTISSLLVSLENFILGYR